MVLLRVLYSLLSAFIFVLEFLENVICLHYFKPHGVTNTEFVDDKHIHTDTGYQKIAAVHKKRLFTEWEIETSLGKILRCADNHIVFCERIGDETFVKDLVVGDLILTTVGLEKVVRKRKRIVPSMMYDITTDDTNHRYYTDDILSHNSITVAIYIVHYILTHTDRNIVLLSQNQDKVTDLMDKIRTIIQNLPFFLKPGIKVDNIMTMQFDNDVNLAAKTTTENSAAGITGHLIYIDEFALINPNFIRSFFRTVYPALSSSNISQMIITSTARGTNKFYDIYQGAIDGENSFDPLRTDWYEVPKKIDENGNVVEYRDDAWKALQVANLGSEEDFNQEYGNQFLAGSQLLFGSAELQKLKHLQIDFIEYEFDYLDEVDVKYRDCLKFHPSFNIEDTKTGRFVFSIDLAAGGGGDYSVINIYQLLPMTRREIEALKIYTDERDFFKLVQIGIWRSNIYDSDTVAKVSYHLFTDMFDGERCKAVLEYNYDGKYFIKVVGEIYGEETNNLDIDSIFVHFPVSVVEKTFRVGLTLDEDKREFGCKLIKDKVKNNQMIIVETASVNEAISFYKNKRGKYIGQAHDDIMLTNINMTHIYGTDDYFELVEDAMEEMSDKFRELVEYKLSRAVVTNNNKDDDSYADYV